MASSRQSGEGGSMRHQLPQIPSMSSSRLVVSKASLKQYPDNIEPFANVVPLEELEGKKKSKEANASESPGRSSASPSKRDRSASKGESSPSKRDKSPKGGKTTEGLPSPPSETPSETPPKSAKAQPESPTKTSPTTPIKLKIRRSVEKGGKSQLISTLQEDEETTPRSSEDNGSQGVVRKGIRPKHHKKGKTGTPKQETVSEAPSSTTKSDGESPPSGKKKRGRRKRNQQEDPSEPQSTVAESPKDLLRVEEKEMEVEDMPVRAATFVPEKKPDLELAIPPKWLVGDLVWAKVSGHPWWPCMLSFDPLLGIYVREVGSYKIREYHVQFFGDVPERAWVKEPATREFKGLDEFEEFCDDKIKANKKDKAKYLVAPRKKQTWSIAVASAEGALPKSRNDRRQEYTFLYEPPKEEKKKEKGPPNGALRRGPKPKQVKRKMSLASESDLTTADDSESEPPKKRRKQSVSKSSDRSPPHRPVELSASQERASNKLANKEVAQFMVFCQKRRDQVKEENPEFSKFQVEQLLEQKWAEMEQEERSRFIPMGMDVQNLSAMLPDDQTLYGSFSDGGKRPRRQSRPSKKFEENEFEVEVSPVKKRRQSSAAGDRSADEDMDDIISGVAAGLGEIMEPADWHGCSSADEGKKARKEEKKKVAASASEDSEVDDYELEIFRLSNSGPTRKENVCLLCEQPGELITCEGPCLGSFHPTCLGLKIVPTGPFKCDECVSGVHTCFVCKKCETNVRKCSVSQCGRFYHEDCVKRYPNARIEENRIYCPLHTCATCAAASPKNPKATKGRLYRCVRCPTAYHIGDYCLAAGSMNLAGFNIVCSQHFQPVKTQSHHSHINVSWCFMCSKGGTLLCCESCPAAFHADCLGIPPPEEAWFCPSCVSGHKPLYGNIVWVKLGSYRWWPGEICHPRNVPLNIQEKPHQVGEFPIRFFGSKDFFWTHQGRVFLFQEGDKGSRESTGTKGLIKIFQKAVREAARAFQIWTKALDEKEQQEMEKSGKKPPPYKHIKTNIPVGNVQLVKANISTITKCECKPDAENPCGPDSDCYNRLLMYECHPQVCPAGERCQNQRFQRREYPTTETIKTDLSGWGLRTLVDIKKHQFVHEYVGELVDEEECRRRLEQYHQDDINNFYMLTIDKNRVIDAGPKGNLSRFMNHSCDPNCETQKWTVGGDIRVGLFAKTDIPAGTELTFNYNLDCLGNEKKACHCGAPNCSGFLGARPKSSNGDGKKEKKKKKKRKPRPDIKKEHEDDCYRCGEGGELVMCDKTGCPKAYHLQCLNLAKPPHGKWVCPWHHCDDCGKLATKLCSECPNSFCHTHCPENIFDIGEGKLVCADHDEMLQAIESSRRESGTPGIKPVLDDGKSATPSESTMSSRASSPVSSESESCPSSKSSDRLQIVESEQSAPTSNKSTPRYEPEPPKPRPSTNSTKREPQVPTPVLISHTVKPAKKPRKSTGERKPRKSAEGKATPKTPNSEDGPKKKRGRPPKNPSDSAQKNNKGKNAKGKSKSVARENNNQVKAASSPMCDTDDEFGNLVIDIPL